LAHIYNERMRKAKKMAAFWLAAPSSGLWWRQYRPLKRRQTHTSLHGATTQKAAIFILTAVRTSSHKWGRPQEAQCVRQESWGPTAAQAEEAKDFSRAEDRTKKVASCYIESRMMMVMIVSLRSSQPTKINFNNTLILSKISKIQQFS
jgi:hypothetical protein